MLDYNTLGKTIEYNEPLRVMIRILTGENIPRGIPLTVIDKGRPFKRYFTCVKTRVETLPSGEPLVNAQTMESRWVEVDDEKPLIVSDGSKRYTITWKSIDEYKPPVEREDAGGSARQARAVTTKAVASRVSRALKDMDEEKLQQLAALLGL
nr:MAG TPA: hypothetical protein [Caudoviricetes sp.]